MTKEDAFEQWWAESEYFDTVDKDKEWTKYTWGIAWDAAIQSLTPHALPDLVPYKEIIDIANEVLGKNYRVTEAHRKHIKARWNEGYRQDDFRKVCETKREQWDHDPKFRMFLRPETLFGTKFDSYLNEETTNNRCTVAEGQ